MGLLSKIFGKKGGEEGTAKKSSEEFMYLIRVYYQALIAERLGVTNLGVLADLGLFKRMLKIPTQNGRLGLAERARAKKILKADYNMSDDFFKEIDNSIKRNCRNVNDIQPYFFRFQGFTTDLFSLISELMKWKGNVPSFMKKALYSITQNTVHDIMHKSTWKTPALNTMAWNTRKAAETLQYSESWTTEFVYNVLVLAKKERRKKDDSSEK